METIKIGLSEESKERLEKLHSNMLYTENYKFDTKSFNRLKQSMNRMLASIAPTFEETNIGFQELTRTVENSFSVIAKEYINYDFSEELKISLERLAQYSKDYIKDYRETYKMLVKKLSELQIEQIKDVDSNSLFSNIAYDIANEQAEDKEEEITIEELQEAYKAELEDKVGFQEWLYNQTESFKKKYYIFYLILNLIFSFIGVVAGFYINEALAKGSVKKEPTANTNIIYNITQETGVTIIGDVNYYYEITFVTPEGEEIRGYIAKRNVKTSVSGNELVE